MKYTLPIAICILFFAASCTKTKELTPQLTPRQIDSIVAERTKEIAAEAAEDFDMRSVIVVRQKADSIVQAHMERVAPHHADTVQHVLAEP